MSPPTLPLLKAHAMDPIRLVEFDIHGTNPVNKIPGEKIPLTDKDTNWVIPNGAPFFGEYPLTRVYDQDGAELTLNRDWFFEGDFVPFCEITGRRISSFIRLTPAVVTANAFITVDYQSIGAWFVPRNDMEEWLELIMKGNVPIPWSKVFGVPPTLPSSLHLHSIKTEIGDWHELTFFFNYLAGVMQTVDTSINAEITTAVDAAFARLRDAKGQYLQQLIEHDENYHNPHRTTKFHILMGNHPNWGTATLAEDLAGLRNDVLSTPLGIQELAKRYIPNTDGAMKSGILPLSRFAGDNYIPPVIDGSFEGLGSLTDSSGICLEPNKQVMILTNHYDGRTEGLYYSILSDHDKTTARLRYTAFKYEPPVLKNQGIEVNRIINGSGNKVIMTGISETRDWYIALTNGSFDPSGHWYVKCDMTAVIAAAPGLIAAMENLLTIHHMGDYLVLFHPYVYNVIADRYAMFRVKTEDVRAGRDVVWERMKLSYQDYDGNQLTNQDWITPASPVRDGNNKITKFACWEFPVPVDRAGQNGRRVATWSAPHKTNKALHYLHTVTYPTFFLDSGLGNASYTDFLNMAWEVNPATGVLTKIAQSPTVVMDFGPNPVIPPGNLGAQRLQPFVNAISPSAGCSSLFFGTGQFLIVYTATNNIFPTIAQSIHWPGLNTDSDILSGGLEKLRIGTPSFNRGTLHEKIAPILSGAYPSTVGFEADGEIYGTVEPGLNTRAIYHRKVSGGFQVREGIDNLNTPEVLSRPLSNNIFKTNLLHEDILINITGSAERLAAGGVECGSMAFSAGAWSNYYTGALQFLPLNPLLRKPGAGVLVTFPRTYKRTVDVVTRAATYEADSFFGFNQAIINKVKTFIPAAHQATKWWSFTFYMLDGSAGQMFNGLNLGIIQLHYMDVNTAQPYVVTLLVTPAVEAPNASHVGIHLITDFTVLDQTAAFRGANGSVMNNTGTLGFMTNSAAFRQRPSLQIYNDGTRLQIYCVGSYYVRTTGTSHAKLVSSFDIVLGTRKIENMYAGGVGWGEGEIIVNIPRIGPTDSTKSGTTPENSFFSSMAPTVYANTGGAGTMVKRTVNDVVTWFLTCTAYAETGWILYLQDGIPVMLNGTVYEMPGGTIDLRDVDINPANKKFYLYATVEDDEPRYIISSEKLRESGSLMKAAELSTNEKQILTINRYQPFVVGDYKLSLTREGGTIPVSAGFPQDEGKFIFLRYAELKP